MDLMHTTINTWPFRITSIYLDECQKVDHTSIELFVNVDNLKLVNPEIMEDNQNGEKEITDLRNHIPTILIFKW